MGEYNKVIECNQLSSKRNLAIVKSGNRDRKIGVSFDPRARRDLTVDFIRPIPPEQGSLRRKVEKWYMIREKVGFCYVTSLSA